MDFGKVLGQAARTVWEHKVLWIFGILAGCTVGTSDGGNVSYQFSGRDDLPQGLERFFDRFGPAAEWQVPALLIILFVVAIVFVFLFLALGALGRAGVIRGTMLAQTSERHLGFGELLDEGLSFFWRLLGLNLLVGVAIILLFVVFFMFFVGIAVVTLGIGVLCLLPLLCLMVPLFWFLQTFLELANVAIVVEDVDITTGLRRGWQVVSDNLGAVLLMAVILTIGVGWIAGSIISIPLLLAGAPLVGGLLADTPLAVRSGVVLGVICFGLYLPILIVLRGILQTYLLSSWTLTYLELAEPSVALESASA
jgi:hypothetical protein